jgi:hypothetical protein
VEAAEHVSLAGNGKEAKQSMKQHIQKSIAFPITREEKLHGYKTT